MSVQQQAARDAAELVIADPGDAKTIGGGGGAGYRCNLTTGASNETRTLADPTQDGETLTITLKTDGGGNCDITPATAGLRPASFGGLTTTLARADFDVAGDTLTLRAVNVGGTLKWSAVELAGAILSS